MKCVTRVTVLFALLLVTLHAYAYRVIAPLPFSIANKNYVKVQVLADAGDPVPDSVFCDVLYNSGSHLVQPMDSSLATVLTLNPFNDGVFYIKVRVWHNGKCDTMGSVFAQEGIPVLLDRHTTLNETSFSSAYLINPLNLDSEFSKARQYVFAGNNNSVRFSSLWNSDSLYFRFSVTDAQLNDGVPAYWDFFQAKKYLQVLWTADCIEIGLDLLHNHSEWKGGDDYEFLANIRGNTIGNRWSVKDSLYANWGKRVRTSIALNGTLNQNQDTDSGYTITLAIPWEEMNFTPKQGQTLGFDIQLYDKDADLDEPFRSSLSGTNPESNDNTSEWVNLVLEKKPEAAGLSMYWLFLPLGFTLMGLLYLWYRKRKKPVLNQAPVETEQPDTPHPVTPIYSEAVAKAIRFIAAEYEDTELSRKKIADHVFLSEKYLSTIFKKETGENLLAYINRYRVEQAIQLLKQTRLSVSEIAFKVGYNSLQNFNKNFRDTTQKTPSDYRKGGEHDF